MFRSLTHLAIAVVAVLVLQVAPASAQSVCDNPDNLTLNCAFDFGIGGWTLGMGDSFAYSTDGHYGPGSIEINAGGGMGNESSIYQCIDGIAGLPAADGGFWVRVVSGLPYGCSFGVYQYSASGCNDFLAYDGGYRVSFPSTWNWVGGHITIDASAVSVEVEVRCSNSMSDFTIRFDDVCFGPGLGLVFSDGFESGDWSKWSTKFP